MKKKLLLLFVSVVSILAMVISSGAVSVFADNDADAPVVDTGAIGDGNVAGEESGERSEERRVGKECSG